MNLSGIFNLKKRIVLSNQLTSTDCGAACLCMIAGYFGKKYSMVQIKTLFEFTRVGVTIQDIVDGAKEIGFSATSVKLSIDELDTIPFPIILYWKQEHFLVYSKMTKSKGIQYYHLYDPAYGKVKIEKGIFESQWRSTNAKGVAIILQPEEDFKEKHIPSPKRKHLSQLPFYREISSFLKKNKYRYIYSFLLMIVGLVSSWAIPFVFQRIIDDGVSTKQLNIVFYFLFAQLVLFLSYFISDFLSRLTLTKFNYMLSILLRKSLLFKLMKLPINYFDTRLNTETLQRFEDQNRIQTFFTWKGIEFIMNILNLIVFGSILLYYNNLIFSIYCILTVFSVVWVLLFLKKRSVIEYAMFLNRAENNNIVYEFIMNMPEIKINNAQTKTIKKITLLQDSLNKLELRSLFLNIYQLIGINFLSKIKEIIAIGICAYYIIEGTMTLGVLLSISFILGQLNGPVSGLIDFIKVIQDTKISTKRIEEIHNTEEEDIMKSVSVKDLNIEKITIKDLSFKYPGKFSPFILKNISMEIVKDTVTAIVGASGSGKTTLLKLLLSYYHIEQGEILLDTNNINSVFSNEWRDKCGIVLQEGKIFSGTIADNIALSEEEIDNDKLERASKISVINDFVNKLPMGFNTKIGNAGLQLSGGQQQRILIARAVYKNPEFLFLDEATSALDAENEKIIHDNLQEFFKGKTVVIIAHRLSTVKKAHQIIALKDGEIIEIGNHQELVINRAAYYNLVKNQLELGN